MGGVRLARLLEAIGASGDEGGLPLVQQHAEHPTPAVHVAACAAMVRLHDAAGARRLARDLEGSDAELRRAALDALRDLDSPEAVRAVGAHVERYLAAAGAVPSAIEVFAPLLVDPVVDVARLVGERLRRSEDSLHLAIGPLAGRIAEEQRAVVDAATGGWRCLYTTPRHSVDEQLANLAAARDAARAPGAPPVLLLGPLPAPEGPHPLADLLSWLPANPYTVRVLYLGPTDLAAVIAWWRYADSEAEVPIFMEVILDLVTLAADRMTEEERILMGQVAPERRDRFARALLGHV
jgi:hypothetical protein